MDYISGARTGQGQPGRRQGGHLFAGHGDVETLYPDEPGHLLVYDTPCQ